MFLLLAAQGLPEPQPADVRPKAEARASVRVERPAIANRKAWEDSSASARRVVTIRDERGQPVLVRVIEYQ
jgi:hypothetical protein